MRLLLSILTKKTILIIAIYISGFFASYYIMKKNVITENKRNIETFGSEIAGLEFSLGDQLFCAGISVFSWVSFTCGLLIMGVDRTINTDLSEREPL